jgi:hypothetical protein
MAKRKAKSQIGNLTPDHQKSKIVLIFLRASGMPHIIEKVLTRATTLLQTSSQSEICTQSYGPSKSQKSQLWEFQDSRLGVPGQNDI